MRNKNERHICKYKFKWQSTRLCTCTWIIGKFAIPSIISMLVAAAYNITDQIFIGRLVGMLGNGATSVAFPVVNLYNGFCPADWSWNCSKLNINMGAKREKEAKHFVGTGITLMPTVGLLIFCIVLF